MVEALQQQITVRLGTENQLVVVAVALAGAAASFGAGHLAHSPNVLALLALLFAALTGAMLRQEYQIVAANGHLLDTRAFGAHAVQHAYWARYAERDLRSGRLGKLTEAVQAAGVFAVPVIATGAFTWAALVAHPAAVADALIAATLLTFVFVAVAGWQVYTKYGRLGREAKRILRATSADSG